MDVSTSPLNRPVAGPPVQAEIVPTPSWLGPVATVRLARPRPNGCLLRHVIAELLDLPLHRDRLPLQRRTPAATYLSRHRRLPVVADLC